MYRVIEFEEFPKNAKQFVIVPDSWVATFSDGRDESRALVKYPEDQKDSETREQVEKQKLYVKKWKTFTAHVIYTIDKYKYAQKMVTLKERERRIGKDVSSATLRKGQSNKVTSDTPREKMKESVNLSASQVEKYTNEKVEKRKREDDSPITLTKKGKSNNDSSATSKDKRKIKDDSSGIPAKKREIETAVEEKIRDDSTVSPTAIVTTTAKKGNYDSSAKVVNKQATETAEKKKEGWKTQGNVSNKENIPHRQAKTTSEVPIEEAQLEIYDPNVNRASTLDRNLPVETRKHDYYSTLKQQHEKISNCQIVIKEKHNFGYKQISLSKEMREIIMNISRRNVAKYIGTK